MRATGERTIPLTLGGVLLLGALLRLNEYLANRPLWIDELMLALNIGRHSFSGLLQRLDYEQAAPLLFLWSVKAASLLGGMTEYALRAIPLLAGVLLPWIVFRVGETLAGAAAGLIAAALAVVSLPLVYYAAEVKPYGIDALVAATLLLLTLRARESPGDAAAWRRLAVGGLLGLLTSLPALFVLPGSLAALAADRRLCAAPTGRAKLLKLTALWAGAGIILVLLVYRPGMANPYLRRFWEGTFLLPGHRDFGDRLYNLVSAVVFPLTSLPAGLAVRWVAALLVGGALLLARRGGASALLLIGVPFLALATASVLGSYPISGRLLLALAPATFLLVATLLAELLRMARAAPALAGAVGTLLVLLLAAPRLIANGREPVVREEGRESARIILRRPGPVYVLASSLPAWAFYTTDWSRPDAVRLDRFARLARGAGPSAPNDLLPVAPADSAVAGRLLRQDGRSVLVGFRSGLLYREPLGPSSERAPDSWAAREADAIVPLATPYVWIYGAHWSPRELPALREALYRRGVRVVEEAREQSAIALRLRAGRSGPP
ncbi:MAG TPA: glycosyltransferase family 39 protein [Gemmatimonadales bacterium]|nr:glycosyltransferase family 39 protein [Gemmatimonadales bacterium]